MSEWRKKPFIYQINTAVWLTDLSRKYDTDITLANVPDSVLDRLADLHMDSIWLMGVWQRSPAVRASALNYVHEYEGALPDIVEEDVAGSAYAIGAYTVDTNLGGRKALAKLRDRLQSRGLKLILDYVPNHVAVDHPWVTERPHLMVRGTRKWMEEAPDLFFETTTEDEQTFISAHGRDPYFPGWIDTAQLNAFSRPLRAAATETLLDIADQCDGVRCDMAMLMTNEVFTRTWGNYLNESAPRTEYWEDIIPQVKEQYPDFIFIAEVYWDMEYTMLQHGFDYTYDKRLYDRIQEGHIPAIRDHLHAAMNFQEHQVRFIENHDEPRAAATLGVNKGRAAAVLTATLPGAVLLHDGQFVGRHIKLPVQIKRQPEETPHLALENFYRKLLAEATSSIYQKGQWRLLDIQSAYADNHTNMGLIAYGWAHRNEFRLVVINLTPVWSNGVIKIHGWKDLNKHFWRLYDVLGGVLMYSKGSEIAEHGLQVDVEAYQSHIFRFERLDESFEMEYLQRGKNKH